MEGQAAEPAEPSARTSLPAGAERAGGVLEQRDTVRHRGPEILPRRRAAEEMHDEHRLGPGRKGGRHRLCGEVHRLRVDVREDRVRSGERDDVRRRGEGVRRYDDLVARPDPECQHRQVEGCGAGRHHHGVLDLAGAGELALELVHPRAHRQLPALEDRFDRGELLGPEVGPGEPDHVGAGCRSLYHAIVRLRPSSRSTFGSQASSLRALSMLGIRISTSV